MNISIFLFRTTLIASIAAASSASAAITLPTTGTITFEAEAFDSQVGTSVVNDATFASGGQFIDQFQNAGTDYIQFNFLNSPNPAQQYQITLNYRCGLTPPSAAVISEVVPGPASQDIMTINLTNTGWGGNPFAAVNSGTFTFSSDATAIRFKGIDIVGTQASHLKGAYHLDSISITAIPEASGSLMGATGFLLCCFRHRRRS